MDRIRIAFNIFYFVEPFLFRYFFCRGYYHSWIFRDLIPHFLFFFSTQEVIGRPEPGPRIRKWSRRRTIRALRFPLRRRAAPVRQCIIILCRILRIWTCGNRVLIRWKAPTFKRPRSSVRALTVSKGTRISTVISTRRNLRFVISKRMRFLFFFIFCFFFALFLGIFPVFDLFARNRLPPRLSRIKSIFRISFLPRFFFIFFCRTSHS